MNAIATRIQDAGFGRPRGLLGRIGGRLMARGNAATERRAVDEAALGPDDVALVVGPGPGIGLQAAGERCRLAIGIDPSPVMRRAAQRRCRALVAQGRVRVEAGVARLTGLPDASVDAVLTVNNVHVGPDRAAGLAELHRVLRPGGRLVVSVHQQWLPGGADGLAADVEAAGFGDVLTWTWDPPGLARPAVQLGARR